MTFEELIPRASRVFYKVWIDEATEEECAWWRDYFERFPNKGSYEAMYKNALSKSVKVLFTSWDYETPLRIDTPKKLLKLIKEKEREKLEIEEG